MKANREKVKLDFMTLVLALSVGQSMSPSLIKSIINTAEPKHVIGMNKANVRQNIDVDITGCEFWASTWLFAGKLDTSHHQSSWQALGREWRWSYIVTLSVMTKGIFGAVLVVLGRTWEERSTTFKHQNILFIVDNCDTGTYVNTEKSLVLNCVKWSQTMRIYLVTSRLD